ncbi:endo-1,4-beta-xylanase [Caulobacter sp. S45]|uniref:endo-1,4-beta-xylanase n=1 Tax=Caulobacter sp. S45 TaxID=1641861 RepID=UPI0020C72690|nr:endo-1,4-beta-xylanase [Caulobacter sp. S45]
MEPRGRLEGRYSRRAALAGALALSACGRGRGDAQAQPYDAPNQRLPALGLRDMAQVPVGNCISTAELDNADYVAMSVKQCSQIIPAWQFQMEATLRPDGGFQFEDADRIAAFARANALALHATALVWYTQEPPALKALDGQPDRFALAVRNYVQAIAGRYRGQAGSWDVVNEPIRDDGSGLRDCLFSRNLGQEDYIVRAFAWAREADPSAMLVLNDYDLERTPRKRWAFMRLVERLLKRGVPVQALGTQSHLDIGMDPAVCRPAMRELATLGLPIRVSELDVSFQAPRTSFMPRAQKLALQAQLYAEVVGGFLELPRHQQVGFAVWGLDDKRSWLRYRPGDGAAADCPCPFDDDERPKPAFFALADAFSRG